MDNRHFKMFTTAVVFRDDLAIQCNANKIQNDTKITFIWFHRPRELGGRHTITLVESFSNVYFVKKMVRRIFFFRAKRVSNCYMQEKKN